MNRIKQWLLFKLTKELLPTVIRDYDILLINKQGKMFFGNVELTEQQIRNLQAELKALETGELWKIINNYLNQLVSTLVFQKSQTITDLVVGKTILYTLGVQKSLLKKIKDYKI